MPNQRPTTAYRVTLDAIAGSGYKSGAWRIPELSRAGNGTQAVPSDERDTGGTRMMRNPWQETVAALEAENIDFVFGMPGNAKQFFDQLYDAERLRTVLVRHETSGAFMAYAYARVTGKVGVCYGCPGPGVANLVPGILEAYSGCLPVLALSVRASTHTEGMGAFQETDHLGMMRPITKWAVTVERPERIGWTIRRAIQIASSGKPGPVYVEIPADIALQDVEMPPYIPADPAVRPGPDPDRISMLASMIYDASRPVIVCGGGAMLSRANDEVRAVAERFGIPVLATPAGRGIMVEDHQLFCGSVGLYRTEFPKSVYQEADLLITLGSRMEEFQSAAFTYFPDGAKFVQVDIDPFELGRNWVPDLAIQSDVARALRALLDSPKAQSIGPDQDRLKKLASDRAAALAHMEDDVADDSTPVVPRRVVRAINEVFGRDTITVLENGKADLWAYYWPYHQILSEGGVVPPAEQTAMGLGVCGAIGAKLAEPEKFVVSTSGDGAFQMGMHELPTAVDEKAPVTWVVLNDGALGWPNWTQRGGLGGREIGTRFGQTFDFVAVAEAAGCRAERVEQPGDLTPALERARQANAEGVPAVVEVIIDPDDLHQGFIEFHAVR
jgi:acetolactate synthase I/II/III large subunit